MRFDFNAEVILLLFQCFHWHTSNPRDLTYENLQKNASVCRAKCGNFRNYLKGKLLLTKRNNIVCKTTIMQPIGSILWNPIFFAEISHHKKRRSFSSFEKKTFSTFRIPSNPIVAMCFVCEKSGRQGEKTQSKNIFNTNIGRWQKVLYIYFRTSEQFPVNCFSSLNMFSHYLFGLHTFFFLVLTFFLLFFRFLF